MDFDKLAAEINADLRPSADPGTTSWSVVESTTTRELTAALTEAQATIARLEAELRLVEAGPFRGEAMGSWIRYRMVAARAALSPGEGGG